MYTRDDVLDKLIAAGLGDIEQPQITPDQFERAMAGEIVIPQRPRGPMPGARTEVCARCNGPKENRAWTYCRNCTAERRSIYRARKRKWYLA
jgi:hypothetical protein